jgi:hypothetical protein
VLRQSALKTQNIGNDQELSRKFLGKFLRNLETSDHINYGPGTEVKNMFEDKKECSIPQPSPVEGGSLRQFLRILNHRYLTREVR